MLKKTSIQQHGVLLMLLTSTLLLQRGAVMFFRVLTPLLFWVNLQPQLLFFKTIQSFFFFRFLRVRRIIRKYPKKVWNKITRKLSAKSRVRAAKKKSRIIKWTFIKCGRRPVIIKRKYRRLFRKIGIRLWFKKFFKSKRHYKLGLNFNRLLKRKIQLMQHFTGRLLFSSSKKHNLGKLFNIFRLLHNNTLALTSISNRFYMVTYYLRFNKKYKDILCLTQLHSYNEWRLMHMNALKILFFNKLRSQSKRLLRLRRDINKLRSLKEKKRVRKLKWRRARKHIYSRKRFTKFYTRINIIHQERMTFLHFHNFANIRFHFYYMNFLLNLWNIRSYNWKQIT